ncbi:MAG: hypothetical protein GY824_22630, partial [Delftia sp.]|nr:hypothetical protein [Delftia sp.]
MIAHTGDSVFWLAGAALAYTLGQGDWVEGGRRVFLATILGGLGIWLLKGLFRRSRPTDEARGLYFGLDEHSFPSGHVGRGACCFVILTPLLAPPFHLGLLLWLG